MKPSAIELHIEELVLEGFAPAERYGVAERYSIADAIQSELARLLSAQGVDSSHVAQLEGAQVDAGTFRLAPHGGARDAGEQIARAVHGGLNR